MMGDSAYPVESKSQADLLETFQGELDRYERILNMMEGILAPVLVRYDSPPSGVEVPHEAPMHGYHSSIIRLGQLNNRAENLRSLIRL